ncbi:uncharacterized protein RCH25_008751 [Pelodytes ibericus]
MPKCIVNGCHNRQRPWTKMAPSFSLHSFPRSRSRIKSWLFATGQDFGDVDLLVEKIQERKKHYSFRMCSDHFSADSYTCLGVSKCLKADAIPNIFKHHPGARKTTEHWKEITSTSAEFTFDLETRGISSDSPSTVQSSESQTETDETSFHFPPKKRFMDHDYTDESSRYTFCPPNSLVNKGTNAAVATADKSTLTDFYATCCSRRTQTTRCHMRHAKTSTADYFKKKDVGMWTGLYEGHGDSIEVEVWDYPQQRAEQPQDTKTVLPTVKQKFKYFPTSTASSPEIETPCHEEVSDVSSDLSEQELLITDPDAYSSPEMELGGLCYVGTQSLNDLAAERKFLVFESCLDQLLNKINTCSYNETCKAPITERGKKITGTLMTVHVLCENGHKHLLWRSQPMIGKSLLGNLLASAAVLFSGSHYTKVNEMFTILGMPFMSRSTYSMYQKKFIFPIVDLYYKRDRQATISSLKGKAICLSGDGRCDAPGSNAKLCTYTLFEESSQKVIECNTVRATASTSSGAMECKAFRRCMNQVLNDGLTVSIVATDRHTSIRRVMKKEFKKIRHQLDMWHYCQRLKKKLATVLKKKDCKALAPWNRAIVNHMYASSLLSSGNVELLRESWNSLLYHVVNEHKWNSGTRIAGCDHEELSYAEERARSWLVKDSVPFRELTKFVMDRRLQKDLQYMAEYCHVENIQDFQNVVLKYWPKRVHFSKESITARMKLAILSHNANVDQSSSRIQSMNPGSGNLSVHRYKQCFSKSPKDLHGKNVSESTTNNLFCSLLADVVRIGIGEIGVY